jgi:uncharacterized membrane protein YdbT with pleckstrin-like domain
MDLVERLRNTGLFRFVSYDGLALAATIAHEHQVSPGAILCRQADLGANFFLIDEGEALIQRVDDKGFQRLIGTLREGDSFGVTSLFLPEPRDATIIARTAMRVWTIQRAEFQDLLRTYPRLRRELTLPDDLQARQRMPQFDWLGPLEHVVYFSHRHWVSLARALWFPTLLLVLLLAFLTAILAWGGVVFNPTIPLLIAGGAYLALLVWHWFDWVNDHFVVTTQRISYRQRVVFVYEARSEVPIDRVQNINVIVTLLGSHLGYGVMVVETAAQTGTLHLSYVPDPEEMRSAIWGQAERVQATQRATERRLMAEALSGYLGIDIDEALPHELQPGEGLPEDLADELAPQKELAPLGKVIEWLQTLQILPQVRIATPEQVIWRKHPFFLLIKALPPLLLAALAIPLAVLAQFDWPTFLTQWGDYYPFAVLVLAIFSMAWLVWEVTDWSNDQYIVTNDRIIDVEQRPLLLRSERREASLGMIQNVRFEIPNPWAGLLNYGSVLVQTAGRGDFTFDHVGAPAEVQAEIFRRIEAYRERTRQQEAERRRREMAEWFAVYDELEQKKGGRPAAEGDDELPPFTPEVDDGQGPRSERDEGRGRTVL